MLSVSGTAISVQASTFVGLRRSHLVKAQAPELVGLGIGSEILTIGEERALEGGRCEVDSARSLNCTNKCDLSKQMGLIENHA